MLFAMPSVRRQLGLKSRPAYDPDTRAGRLGNAAEYLRRVLYGSVDTMVAAYGARPKAPVAQPPKPLPKSPPKVPPKAVVSAPKSVSPPRSVAELKARGYIDRGAVTKERTALKIAGAAWKSPHTYYTIRDKVVPGSSLDPAHIEKGMHVWMRK